MLCGLKVTPWDHQGFIFIAQDRQKVFDMPTAQARENSGPLFARETVEVFAGGEETIQDFSICVEQITRARRDAVKMVECDDAELLRNIRRDAVKDVHH